MINMLFGPHPDTGELWCFHTADGKRTPFTDDEMAERRRLNQEEAEISMAKIFNEGFVNGVIGDPMEMIPPPDGWHVSKGE